MLVNKPRNDRGAAEDFYRQIKDKPINRRRADIYGGKSTYELRKGIGHQPPGFQAQHIIPEKLLDDFDDFSGRIGFDGQNGRVNSSTLSHSTFS